MILRRYILNLVMLVLFLVQSTFFVSAQPGVPDDAFSDDISLNINEIFKEDTLSYRVDPNAQPLGIRYTKKHPIIVVGDWKFAPFSFYGDRGDAMGFQMDLVREIFTQLHLPYEIHLMEWKHAKDAVRKHKADLMIDIDKGDGNLGMMYSHNVLARYSIGIAHRIGEDHKPSLRLFTENDTIYVNPHDYADEYITHRYGENPPFHVERIEPFNALHMIADGRIKYYVWSSVAMRYLVELYGLENNIDIDDTDIPDGRFRFVSGDPELLNELDMQFKRLNQAGRYQPIYDRWFNPDFEEYDEYSAREIFVVVTLIIIIVVLALSIILSLRNNSQTQLKREFAEIARLGQDISQSQLLVINMHRMWVYNVSGDFLPPHGLSLREYESLIHPADIMEEYEIRKSIDNAERDIKYLKLRIRKYNSQPTDWREMNVTFRAKFSMLEKPTYVYMALNNIHDNVISRQQLDNALQEFSYITENSELAMIFYDSNGKFANLNKPIITLFDQGGLGRAEHFIRNSTISTIPMILNGVKISEQMDVTFCGPLEVPELNLRTYVEVHIKSINDANGEFRGHTVSMSDLSEPLLLRNENVSVARQIKRTHNELKRYTREMRYILSKNNMHPLRWRVGDDFFEISRVMSDFSIRFSFKDYEEAIMPVNGDEIELLNLFESPYTELNKTHFARLCFRKKEKKGSTVEHPVWFNVYIKPEYNENDELSGIFGLACDITRSMMSIEALRDETQKAQDSGRQKALFLANMTHELRTPLNAINGFAEVLKLSSTPEEKKEYSKIMLQNTETLVRLVDNLLQMSLIDMSGIKAHKEKVSLSDFFKSFDSRLSTHEPADGVELILDEVSAQSVYIDTENVSFILDAFVDNAVKFTKQGEIHVGCIVDDKMIRFYCSDTGCGIAEADQSRIFERFMKLDSFVQGTGLGLPVSLTMAEALGGSITLQSKENEGSTFYLNFPL